MKVSVVNFGCKVNQFEGEAMADLLRQKGFEVVDPSEADLVVINTCVVTKRAQAEARKALRRYKRLGKRVVVCGCWPELDGKEPLDCGADGAFGNSQKALVADLCLRVLRGERVQEVGHQGSFLRLPVPLPRRRTRAFLKIQDGCDQNCTYCVVPLVRGRPRSMPEEEVVKALRDLARARVMEVVLCGIHLGRWGEDLMPPRTLTDLLERIEGEETPPRIRLSSIEPQEVSGGLIGLMARSQKLCPHLHLPVQSASPKVLSLMGRPYTPEQVSEIIMELFRAIPGLALGADFIVGFPQEGEEDFEQTWEFVRGHPFSYLHVFPYSPRPRTPASSFPGQVPERVKLQRVKRLRQLGLDKRAAFYRSFIGKELEVLSEGTRRGKVFGLSRNYIRCLIEAPVRAGVEVPCVGLALEGERLLVRPKGVSTIRSMSTSSET